MATISPERSKENHLEPGLKRQWLTRKGTLLSESSIFLPSGGSPISQIPAAYRSSRTHQDLFSSVPRLVLPHVDIQEQCVEKRQYCSPSGSREGKPAGRGVWLCFKEERRNMNGQWSLLVLFETPKLGHDGPAALGNAAFVHCVI